ncbi:hypothetical protein [Embleya sp. NPDC001921]
MREIGESAEVMHLHVAFASADLAGVRQKSRDEFLPRIVHPDRFTVGEFRRSLLLRMAADRSTRDRADTLELVAVVARRKCWEDGSRTDLLQVADADDDGRFDMSGYFQNWTVEAVHDAIAADAHIPTVLLDDPDPKVREAAAYCAGGVDGSGRGDLRRPARPPPGGGRRAGRRGPGPGDRATGPRTPP